MRASALALVPVLVALVGCGKDEKPAPPVRLSVDAPSDMALLHEDSVDVQRAVAPATAKVSVEGTDVSVNGGRLRKRVDLLPGTNLIDIVAGADHGARPGMVSVRVRQQVA